MRFFIQVLAPLALPTVIYVLWLLASHRSTRPLLSLRGPWVVLISIGLVLVIASLITFAFVQERYPPGTLVMPRFENGQIVPSHRVPE